VVPSTKVWIISKKVLGPARRLRNAAVISPEIGGEVVGSGVWKGVGEGIGVLVGAGVGGSGVSVGAAVMVSAIAVWIISGDGGI
jgi:hypothetical protein